MSKIIQLSFTNDARLDIVKQQLEEIKMKFPPSEYTYASCFLPTRIAKESGYNLAISNLLDSLPNHKYWLGDCDSLDNCLDILDCKRKDLASISSGIVILDARYSLDSKAIMEELDLYDESNQHIMHYRCK